MRRILRKITVLISLNLLLLVICANGQIASGGGYTLNQSVIANGGGTSSNAPLNNYRIEGTAGQSAAGTSMFGGAYTVRGGFWAPDPFAPTAAGASITGRVIDSAGSGLPNITLTLSGGMLLAPRTARTGSFGYFRFEHVEVGHSYILTVSSKKYGFGQNPQIISLLEDATEIVFQADWTN